MSALLAHQKQFVLGPMAVGIRPGWLSVRIAERLVLSYCPKLGASRLNSLDGVDYYLLGLAVLADKPMASVSETFRSKDSSEIEAWTGFWAGKWVLISADGCRQDASGCLGLYYRHAGEEVWISSSPALLSDHLPNIPSVARIPWKITHNKGMDWIPLPLTTREHVYRVLPMRTIDPSSGAIRPVRFAIAKGNVLIDKESLASALKTVLINWAQLDFRERLISLTAGLDTRTLLAAASAANVSAQTYTSNYPNIARRDRILPPRLASRVGFAHRLVGPMTLGSHEMDTRRAAILEHLDNAAFHPISAHLAHGHDAFMHDSSRTFAAGNCFEVGRCFYWMKFSNAGLAETLPSADQLLQAFIRRANWRPEPLASWRKALELWIESLSDPVPLALDWRDRFYLEQRLGGWHSGVQRNTDVLDGTFFYPANCLWVFHLLLLHHPERRQEGFAQREAIRLLAPCLLKIPVNPPTISRRIRHMKQGAKTILGDKTYHVLKSLARALRLS